MLFGIGTLESGKEISGDHMSKRKVVDMIEREAKKVVTPIYPDRHGRFFKLRKVPGNGHCMFIALACGKSDIKNTFSKRAASAAKLLRQEIGAYLATGAMHNAINTLFAVDGEQLRQDLEMDDDNMNYRSAYIRGVKQRLYGDELVRAAFIKLFNIDVQVYELNNGILECQTDSSRKSNTIHILNSDSRDHGAAHFDLLEQVTANQ